MAEFKITKVITKNYSVTSCRKFMTYKDLKEARSDMHTPSTCFCCERKFKDEEVVYLGRIPGELNKIFCSDCGKKIEKSLKEDQ